MSVQKKSLISQRSAVKAAILANPSQTPSSVPSVRPASRPATRAASPSSRAIEQASLVENKGVAEGAAPFLCSGSIHRFADLTTCGDPPGRARSARRILPRYAGPPGSWRFRSSLPASLPGSAVPQCPGKILALEYLPAGLSQSIPARSKRRLAPARTEFQPRL